jgi:predicted dehydrogenase
MKFLICGLGSIGQRHIRMLRRVLGDDADVAAYRSRNLAIVISDKLDATFGEKPEDYYNIKCFTDFTKALAWKPDAVFVTNPISMHMQTAIAAARAGCHIFIEKPLADEEKGVSELMEVLQEKQLICVVGYQLRYHPAYMKIRELLTDNVLGALTFADLHFGEWLPGMHPYEDYRDSHAARKEQGGGVILCLSHEIDIALWLFGKPSRVYAAGGQLSDLQMDVEDTADIYLSCINKGREFPVHVHLDFLQKPARRYIHIVGEKGSILFNYCTNEFQLNLLEQDAPQKIVYDQFQRNDMFFHEVSDFINSIRSREPLHAPSLEEGLFTLKVCMAARESLSTKQVKEIV